MHLAIDGSGIKSRGGATVLTAVVEAARDYADVDRVTVFVAPTPERRFELSRGAGLDVVERPREERSLARRVWWLEHGLAVAVTELRADALLCMSGMGTGGGVPHATFVQQAFHVDAAARHYLSYRRRVELTVAGVLARRSCRAADAVIVQTPTMASAVAHEFGPLRARVVAIPPSVASPVVAGPLPESLRAMLEVPADRRLLYVGTAAPYKNLAVATQSLQRIRDELPGATLFATCTQQELGDFATGLVALGELTPDGLAHAYHGATVLVMPSLVETVGLPMLEAMACDTVVLAADRPYARDVCGDAARYFDPHDDTDLAHRAVELLRDAAAQRLLRQTATELLLGRRDSYRRVIDAAVAVARSR